MKQVRLALRQIGWEQKAYWRNPPAAVFTFAFPVIFLVVFSAINSDSRVGPPGQEVKFTQYYVPAIAAFGVISACYTNLAFTMAVRRDTGLLKRKRGTPLSASTYLAGLIGNALVNALILVVVTLLAGKVLYAGTKDGRLVAFRAAGCPEAACEPLLDVDLGGGAIVAGPIVVDGTVIAGTADGQLVAYGLPVPN